MVLPLGSDAYNSLKRPTHGRLGGFPNKHQAWTERLFMSRMRRVDGSPMPRLVGGPGTVIGGTDAAGS
jgi:hypothetical protein